MDSYFIDLVIQSWTQVSSLKLLSLISGDGDANGLPKGGLYCVSNEVFYKRCAYEKQKKKTKDNDQNKSQINQILSLWGCPLRRFLEGRLSLFRWNEGMQRRSDRFSWSAVWMSPMMSPGARVNAAWRTQHRPLRLFKHELLWWFLKFMSCPFAAVCHCKAQKKSFVLSNSKTKDEKKEENISSEDYS